MKQAREHVQEDSGRCLLVTLLFNAGITVAQVIGEIISGSLSLLADAPLGISYGACRMARRPAGRRRFARLRAGQIHRYDDQAGRVLRHQAIPCLCNRARVVDPPGVARSALNVKI